MNLNQILPNFIAGTQQLHALLLGPAALICYIGLVFRVLPAQSPLQFGWAFCRLTIVVILISNVFMIGEIINGMAMAITNAMGFSIKTNMLGDYQTALATKFSHAIVTQPGNPNPWQWLQSGVDQIAMVGIGTLTLMFSWFVAAEMFFVLAIQQILFYLELAMSPLFLACIMSHHPVGNEVGILVCCDLFVPSRFPHCRSGDEVRLGYRDEREQ